MHIIHSLNHKSADEHAHKNSGFLITNKKGNYLSLGKNNFTHMQGLFFFNSSQWELYKTIEDIRLGQELKSIKNNFFNVQRIYEQGAVESFNLFNNSMIYRLNNYNGKIIIELDFRPMFGYDDKGRIYSVSKEENGIILIRYDKYSDDSLSNIEHSSFMAVKGADINHNHRGEWVKKDYSYDRSRGEKHEFYVYQGIELEVRGSADLVFSFSSSKKEALEHAHKIHANKDYLLSSLKKYISHTFNSSELAMNTAMKALDDLLVSVEHEHRSVGIFAGLPWFFQFWARDELICLKALMLQEKFYLVKSILFKYLRSVRDDGLLPNIVPQKEADINSIDAVGWLFLRLKEYINLLLEKKMLNSYLSVSEIIEIKRVLEKAILGLAHNYSKNGLIINNEQETWMDTKPAKRKGACIEIQALYLSMLGLHNQIAGMTNSKQLFRGLEKEQKQRIKDEFVKQGTLLDCVYNEFEDQHNPSIRPNVFLAYYIYPEMFSKKEWKQAFDQALESLWLGWGGLSSLGYKNHGFKQEYSGSNDISYHNGDSWYYVNNYAALAMHWLDKKYYSKKIKLILQASTEELMFSGFAGCCSEVSSAKHMMSQGCLSQAWSAASLIELMHELGKNK